MNQANKNLFYILLVFAMLGWGGSWVNVKILANYINEYEMIYLRFLITAITMIPIILYLKKSFFILASIFWPIVTILSSKALKISPIVFTFYLYSITTILVWIFFVDISSIAYQNFDSIFWINLIAISLLASTFANTVYFLAVEKLGASATSTFIFLVPFFAIVLSVIFLHEEITLSIILGTVMTLVAIKILNNIKFTKQ
jgi:drug/metabolite transporter (DMT)-like permease